MKVHCKPYDPYNGHDYVEIGGLKWATMNVGATGVTDYGLYFQWGDTQGYTADQVGSTSGKKPFYWDDYKYFTVDTTQEGDAYASGKITKYNSIDGKTQLDTEDDAAKANWGGSWRMPTAAEFAAFGAAVNTAWTNDYQSSGIKGLVCTAKDGSGAELFFPAAGYCSSGDVEYVGSYGGYWSSSLSSLTDGSYVYFVSGGVHWRGSDYRCNGQSVRGVVG